MRIAVYGLWHLGCVTAACVAARQENRVVGFDVDEPLIDGLKRGQPPIEEPGLRELIGAGLENGRLAFTPSPQDALAGADVLWVTFDTPVNDRDEADVAFVRERLERIADHIPRGTHVLVSAQVPAGFTRSLERDWADRGLHFAYSPENLRLGNAIAAFTQADRAVVGASAGADRELLGKLFAPFAKRIEWMSVESAEMTKHAINAFLATSVTFINEIARLCEVTGADAKEVARGLKSEGRIGPRAYLNPGAAFAGGTLARDLRFLAAFGQEKHVATPLMHGALDSNATHLGWLREKIESSLRDVASPVVALLGLTYKPNTSTLRRSTAVELGTWLHGKGVRVRATDPGVSQLPAEIAGKIELCLDAAACLSGADLAVVATEWIQFRSLTADAFAGAMRRPVVIDPNWFLVASLADDRRISYIATGRPT
jgi:UDPglucose 6-dehydrogenase